MDIALHIPTWVLWALGIPVGVAILFFAWLGIMFVLCFSGNTWR